MRKIIPAFMILCLVSCANLVGQRDQNSIDAAVTLKAQTLELLNHAGESPVKYLNEISALRSRLQAQSSYESGKSANDESAKQWEILVSPHNHLLGGFLAEWEGGKSFSPLYIEGRVAQISKAFDIILKTEGSKHP